MSEIAQIIMAIACGASVLVTAAGMVAFILRGDKQKGRSQ